MMVRHAIAITLMANAVASLSTSAQAQVPVAVTRSNWNRAYDAVREAGYRVEPGAETYIFIGDTIYKLYATGVTVTIDSDMTGELEDHKKLCGILLSEFGGLSSSYAAPIVDSAFSSHFDGKPKPFDAGQSKIVIDAPNDRLLQCVVLGNRD
ncbi:hypothetical protein [Pseudorhizobium flavum]|uniref:hypothetical protein n=1 Tax=Pseudorhizobium flavum TaxID=1335061 RepID=UPI0037704304